MFPSSTYFPIRCLFFSTDSWIKSPSSRRVVVLAMNLAPSSIAPSSGSETRSKKVITFPIRLWSQCVALKIRCTFIAFVEYSFCVIFKISRMSRESRRFFKCLTTFILPLIPMLLRLMIKPQIKWLRRGTDTQKDKEVVWLPSKFVSGSERRQFHPVGSALATDKLLPRFS